MKDVKRTEAWGLALATALPPRGGAGGGRGAGVVGGDAV